MEQSRVSILPHVGDFIMECDKLREEYPYIHFEDCCESCHEDSATGYGEDLWFDIEGKLRNVCCAVYNSYEILRILE